jgi:hypothetical protein
MTTPGRTEIEKANRGGYIEEKENNCSQRTEICETLQRLLTLRVKSHYVSFAHLFRAYV